MKEITVGVDKKNGLFFINENKKCLDDSAFIKFYDNIEYSIGISFNNNLLEADLFADNEHIRGLIAYIPGEVDIKTVGAKRCNFVKEKYLHRPKVMDKSLVVANFMSPFSLNADYDLYFRDAPLLKPTGDEVEDTELRMKTAYEHGVTGFEVFIPLPAKEQYFKSLELIFSAAKRLFNKTGIEFYIIPRINIIDRWEFSAESIAGLIIELLDKYKDKGLFKTAGSFLISTFNGDTLSPNQWEYIQNKIERHGHSIFLSLDMGRIKRTWKENGGFCGPVFNRYLEVCDGTFLFSHSTDYKHQNFYSMCKASEQYTPKKYVMGTVQYGYWRPEIGCIFSPHGTSMFRDDWERTIQQKNAAVNITTWNDYSEGAIEPSFNKGHVICEINNYYCNLMKGKKRVNNEIYISYPAEVFVGEKLEIEVLSFDNDLDVALTLESPDGKIVYASNADKREDSVTFVIPTIKFDKYLYLVPKIEIGGVVKLCDFINMNRITHSNYTFIHRKFSQLPGQKLKKGEGKLYTGSSYLGNMDEQQKDYQYGKSIRILWIGECENWNGRLIFGKGEITNIKHYFEQGESVRFENNKAEWVSQTPFKTVPYGNVGVDGFYIQGLFDEDESNMLEFDNGICVSFKIADLKKELIEKNIENGGFIRIELADRNISDDKGVEIPKNIKNAISYFYYYDGNHNKSMPCYRIRNNNYAKIKCFAYDEAEEKTKKIEIFQEESIVADFDLEKAAGSYCADLTGNRQMLLGGGAVINRSIWGGAERSPKNGHFDGADDFMLLSDSAVPIGSNRIEITLKAKKLGADIIDVYNGAWKLSLLDNGAVLLSRKIGMLKNIKTYEILTKPIIKEDVEYNITFSTDCEMVRLWVNDALVGETPCKGVARNGHTILGKNFCGQIKRLKISIQ
ncbi:MAG: hypothetical protein M0R40_00385 [Firmicutes bacterium]|nr:hypothetical protein [Bacillota bacterium]